MSSSTTQNPPRYFIADYITSKHKNCDYGSCNQWLSYLMGQATSLLLFMSLIWKLQDARFTVLDLSLQPVLAKGYLP